MKNPSWVGQTLGGRYKIEELLGQGGMSAVYKANDPNLERMVAVKLIHPHLATNPDFQRRFKEEATAVAMLRHPNIVQVYDFEQDGDITYMVLEYVPGETLQERLKRLNQQGRKLPLEQAVRYAQDLIEAVGYAHQRGMIHRDIKPANIMLDVQGHAILMDFGIAKMMGGTQHTATGATIGTAMYMAPEQIQSDRPDERADLYSLGVTLFEMVSGRPPFEAESAMTLMMMHLNDPVPDLRQIQPPAAPGELVSVIEKALEKDRRTRFQSAVEMGSALRRAMAPRSAQGTPDATVVDAPPRPQDVNATAIDPYGSQRQAGEPTFVDPAAAAGAGFQPTFVERQTGSGAVPPAGGTAAGAGGSTGPAAGGGGAAAGAPPTGGSPSSGAASFPSSRPGGRGISRPLLFAGAGLMVVMLLCLLAGGGFALSRLRSLGAQAAEPTSTETAEAVAALDEELPPADTPTPTLEPTPTITPIPTRTPTPTLTPTPTVPPGRYVRINAITIDPENYYVVDYETFEYTEVLPGVHVHFFFDTVPPEQAGLPGKGPWILYGGPRPFRGYRVSDRPAAALQMCALVANHDHSIILESGNCWDLP
jgi:predicted Ser/Thr protein kinase